MPAKQVSAEEMLANYTELRLKQNEYLYDLGELEGPCHNSNYAEDKNKKRGYVTINTRKNNLGFHSIHQLSYAVYNGPNPDKLHVCHKCDNPKCINPNHLFLGTLQDNMNDMSKKGRGDQKLDKDKDDLIISLYETGDYAMADIAEMFVVSRSTIRDIISGKIRKHSKAISK